MDPVIKFWIYFAIAVVSIVSICMLTYRSSLSRDRKLAVYVTTICAPVIGLFLLLVFRRHQARQLRS